MKSYETLLQDAANVADEIKSINEYFEHSRDAWKYMPISKERLEVWRQEHEKVEQEEKEKSDRLNILKIAGKILHDNIRQAYFQETMPKVLEVLKKYEGKPIGEKTEAKIRDELKNQGIAFSISYGGSYGSDKMHISPIDGANGNFWYFSYDEMNVYTKYDGGNKRPMLGGNGGNRLIVYDMDVYHLANCKDYVDDYLFQANRIVYRYNLLKEHRAELEREYGELNGLLPSGMKYLNIGDHLYQSIA